MDVYRLNSRLDNGRIPIDGIMDVGELPVYQDFVFSEASDVNAANHIYCNQQAPPQMMARSNELTTYTLHIDNSSNQQGNMVDFSSELFTIQPQMIQGNQETIIDHTVASSSSDQYLNIEDAYYNEYYQYGMDDYSLSVGSASTTMTSISPTFQQDEAAIREQPIMMIYPPKSGTKKIEHWTEEGHKMFLIGYEYAGGKNKWAKWISKHIFHGKKTAQQITSHSQKYFIRQEQLLQSRSNQGGREDGDGVGSSCRKRKRIHDINMVADDELNSLIQNGLIPDMIRQIILMRRHPLRPSSMLPLPSPEHLIKYLFDDDDDD